MAERLSDYLRGLPSRVFTLTEERFAELAVEAHLSVKVGSELTGAPGQPVDKGALRNSITLDFPDRLRARITSPMVYAQPIEDGIGGHGPLTLRSAVGGFHSFKLTIANLQRIADAVAARRRPNG